MVRISLQIKAFFENVEKLETEGSNYPYFVKVLCTNCGEKSEKWHDITESVRTSAEDTKNPEGFNFQMKCKMCKRLNTIDIQQNSQGDHLPHDYYHHFVLLLLSLRPYQNIMEYLVFYILLPCFLLILKS